MISSRFSGSALAALQTSANRISEQETWLDPVEGAAAQISIARVNPAFALVPSASKAKAAAIFRAISNLEKVFGGDGSGTAPKLRSWFHFHSSHVLSRSDGFPLGGSDNLRARTGTAGEPMCSKLRKAGSLAAVSGDGGLTGSPSNNAILPSHCVTVLP